jgi:hypothetical protein
MNGMKKITKFLWITFLISGSMSVQSQVNIGSSDVPHEGAVLDLSQSDQDLGLLLPRVELLDVTQFQLPGNESEEKRQSAIGMVIYNTSETTKGARGVKGKFVWNGKRWSPLAIDGGTMTLTQFGTTDEPYDGSPDHEITAEGPETSHVSIGNEGCDMAGSYVFVMIAGNEHARVSPESSVTPDFSINFNTNETGVERKAIVLVTDPCGKTGTFVFAQEAADCPPQTPKPVVDTYFGTTLHANGAVYAYVSSLDNTEISDRVENHNYYWLLNNTLVAEGAGVTLTTAGKYSVYADRIGCGNPGEVTVTAVSTQAPDVKRIVVDNDGIICGTSQVTLSALNAGGSNIWWFKDGIRHGTNSTVSLIVDHNTGPGIWYAVVEASGGASLKSNQVTVSYQSDQTSISAPEAYVNDISFAIAGGIVLCAGGTLKLEIQNPGAYVNPTFTWYANDQVLGVSNGQAIYVVPANIETIILSVKATDVGFCPASTTSGELIVEHGSTPPITPINGGATDAYICGNNPAVLEAGVSNGVSYEWFLGDEKILIATTTENKHTTSSVGVYSVRYQNSQGCWSQISPGIRVTQSSAVSMKWDMRPEAEEIFNSSKTYSVSAAPEAFEYEWEITPAGIATIKPIGNGSAAVVSYRAEGSTGETIKDVVLSVIAHNGCGETLLTDTFDMKTGCVPVSSLVVNPATAEIFQGESVTYSVTVNTGSEPFDYEWFVDNATTGFTGSTYIFTPADAGTYRIHVKVKNCKDDNSGQYGAEVTSSQVTLKVNLNPDPFNSSNTHAIFMGQKTCLDVHKTGDNGTNSWAGDRLPLGVRPDDFSMLSGNTYNFSYTFTALSGYSISNIRYTFKDRGQNNVVSEVIGDGTNTATLKLKSGIVSQATGLTKGNAMKVTLYAIYTYNGNDYKDSVDISIQDGACGCPAKISANTWKMDFCYAVGADYTLDPYIMRPEIYGHYFRWGKKTASASWTGTFSTNVSYSRALAWDMVNENPCPRGWKVAAPEEVKALATLSLNPQVLLLPRDVDGYRGQTRGYVPISGGGYREAGINGGTMGDISERYWEDKDEGHTWTESKDEDNAYNKHFGRTTYKESGSAAGNPKSLGIHVRCMSEGSAYTGD